MAPRIRIRGARTSAPSGYLVGTSRTGSGELQLLSPRDIAASPTLKQVITQATQQIFTPTLAVSVTGLMTDNELIGSVTTAHNDTFANATVTGWAQVPATDDATFTIRINGLTGTILATVKFAAGSNTPTIDWTGETIIPAGTPIFVQGPSPADASLANVNFTITG